MPLNASELTKLSAIQDKTTELKNIVMNSLSLRAVGGAHIANELIGLEIKLTNLPETESDTTPPAAVTNVTATSGSIGAVTVKFNVTFPTDAVAFDVLRSASGAGTFAVVGTVTTNSFSESAVAAGTYDYKVVAKDAAGNVSVDSNIATVTVA